MVKARPVRGAPHNNESRRFNVPQTEADGDWLDARIDIDGTAPPLRTTVTVESPRTIISRNQSPDIPFDRSINPYRGCEHGCIYCFARPTHAYHDLSAGIRFRKSPVRQADCGRVASRRTRQAGLCRDADGAWNEYRSVPADRAALADHA